GHRHSDCGGRSFADKRYSQYDAICRAHAGPIRGFNRSSLDFRQTADSILAIASYTYGDSCFADRNFFRIYFTLTQFVRDTPVPTLTRRPLPACRPTRDGSSHTSLKPTA